MSKEPESSSKSDSIPNTSISTYHTASRCRRWSRNGFSTGMKRPQNPYNLPVNVFFFIFAWSIIVAVSLCKYSNKSVFCLFLRAKIKGKEAF